MEILIIAIFIGVIPAVIASNKGHNFLLWWFFGSAMFIVAFPASIIIKPDKQELEKTKKETGMRKCPYCAEFVKKEARLCRYCGSKIEPIKEEEKLIEQKKEKREPMTIEAKQGFFEAFIVFVGIVVSLLGIIYLSPILRVIFSSHYYTSWGFRVYANGVDLLIGIGIILFGVLLIFRRKRLCRKVLSKNRKQFIYKTFIAFIGVVGVIVGGIKLYKMRKTIIYMLKSVFSSEYSWTFRIDDGYGMNLIIGIVIILLSVLLILIRKRLANKLVKWQIRRKKSLIIKEKKLNVFQEERNRREKEQKTKEEDEYAELKKSVIGEKAYQKDKKFNRQVERNLKGRKLEQEGEIDEAIRLYEQNINENFDGNHPYDRLAIIYRKRSQVDKEIRVLGKAIWVFENIVYKDRADRIPKLERFKERLEKAKLLI